jgi:hypothetical protein
VTIPTPSILGLMDSHQRVALFWVHVGQSGIRDGARLVLRLDTRERPDASAELPHAARYPVPTGTHVDDPPQRAWWVESDCTTAP